ncbi:MAG TPA: aldo/keto reductase [Kofleriaceae bacterium]|nr:aldo/keto reductase [Kofleriaceae bacterium]
MSAIGLGCMGMSEFYGPADDATSIDLIHQALERGMSFFDTADMYGSGRNEELVGKALADRRDRAVIATKFAFVRNPDGTGSVSGKPAYVKSACEASLRRLKIETIDLYYQHRVDPSTPIEDTIGAMADLVKEGKVRFLGMSEAAPATIRRAHKVHPITALQTEYSLWTREPEQELLALCQELGIAFVAYSPLGRGFLTNQIKPDALAADDFRRHNPRFAGDNLAHNQALVDKLAQIASAKGCTPAQLALAWLLARAPHIIPIPGTRKLSRLEENLAAADLRLTADDLAMIDKVAPPGAAAGTRYPAERMAMLNR